MKKTENQKEMKKIERKIKTQKDRINLLKRQIKYDYPEGIKQYKNYINNKKEYDSEENIQNYKKTISVYQKEVKRIERKLPKEEAKLQELLKTFENLKEINRLNDIQNPFKFSKQKLPEKKEEELMMTYCKRNGFEKQTVRGYIGDYGSQTHILECYIKKVEDGIQVACATSDCGSAKWNYKSGSSKLYILDDNIENISCERCKKLK